MVRESSDLHRDTLFDNRIDRALQLSPQQQQPQSPDVKNEDNKTTIERKCEEFLERQLEREEESLEKRRVEI